jgi:hypothetical protein
MNLHPSLKPGEFMLLEEPAGLALQEFLQRIFQEPGRKRKPRCLIADD